MVFFGRDEQVDQLLERLGRQRFLAVVGTSGCGKSSLVRAGLIPALGTGLLGSAGARWAVATMRPGDRPLWRLAEALLDPAVLGPAWSDLDHPTAQLHAALQRGPLGLVEVLDETPLPGGRKLLLLVDQFEELFRYRREGEGQRDEANAFVSLLLATARETDRPVYIVLTMRSDYLGDCALFDGLPEALNDSQFLTPKLTRDQRQQAIEGPARVFDGRVEPALVTRLLNDMGSGPDQLPLMQHALMRLWKGSAPAADGPVADRWPPTRRSVAWRGPSPARPTRPTSRSTPKGQRIAEVLFRRLSERDDRRPRHPPADASRGGRRRRRRSRPRRCSPWSTSSAIPTFPSSRPLAAGDPARRHPRHQPRESDPPLGPAPRTGCETRPRRPRSTAGSTRRPGSGPRAAPACGVPLTSTRPCAGRRRPAPNKAWAARYGGDFDRAIRFLDASVAERERKQAEEQERGADARSRRTAAWPRPRSGRQAEVERGRSQTPNELRRRFLIVAAVSVLLAAGRRLCRLCGRTGRAKRPDRCWQAKQSCDRREARPASGRKERDLARQTRTGGGPGQDRDLTSTRRPLRVGAEQAPGPLAPPGGRSSPDREHLRGTR